jgi:hypothetical protein
MKRAKNKPVEVGGRLVTPVTGLPAAPINWSPPCPVCRVRECEACHALMDYRETECQCGGPIGESKRCPLTKATSTQDGLQYCKCLRCGHTWSRAVRRKL